MTETDGQETKAPLRWLKLRQGVVVCVLVLLGGPFPSAQTRQAAPQPATPADAAVRALDTGDFDEVDRILGKATDSRSIAIRARAAIARGRYADAEKLLSGPASSEPGSDAALELGLLQLYLGRRAEGNRTLSRLRETAPQRSAADHVRLGVAAQALGDYAAANRSFRDANRVAPNDPIVNTKWGELFLEKYELGEAQKSFEIALKADENNVSTQLGVARLLTEQNPPAAKEAVERVLKTNPKSVPAHLLAAEMALDDRRRDDAKASIAKALEVNPNSLEARSLQASLSFLQGRQADFEREVQEALKINPAYGDVYRTVADHAARNYLFDEAVGIARKGLAIDPQNTRAHASLGVHLLRTGDEAAARTSLELAFKGDPFNSSLVTKNLLTMLDTLDKFETIRDGDLVFKFHPDEAAVMREQAIPLAKEAFAALTKHYQFTPKGPILIEMFTAHDDFAVRTIGLPGFNYALGACFGRVVTIDSPKVRPPREFNWGETLWHEIAHVYTLQMSNNRMPRWLSEGMSQYEERRARQEWGRESEVPYAQALEEGRLMKLDKITEGLTDPKLATQTYHQASLVVDYLVDTYGEPALHNVLRAYGRGLETEEAFREVYKVGLADIQAGFDAKMERDYAALRRALKRPETKGAQQSVDDLKKLAESNPGSFAVQMQLGFALQKEKESAGAIQAFEKAAALVPSATGEGNPNAAIAGIAMQQKDTARAIRALEAVIKVENTAVAAARQLATLLEPLGDPARSESVYRYIVAIDPFDSQAQGHLGRQALKRKDTQAALRAFRSALAANPPDRATAHADLAEVYLVTGQLAEARKQTLAALEIAPSFERAQDLLLKIVEASPGER